MVAAEAAERFEALAMFHDVDPETRRALLAVLVEDRSPPGTVLLTQGQPNDHLSFLIGGSETIERAGRKNMSEILATIHAPSVFGTTTFFTPNAPTFSVRAAADVWLLTLYHPAHNRLRRDHPAAAEALAVAAVRVLSDRFGELDRAFSDHLRGPAVDPPRINEWAGFRARLFEGAGRLNVSPAPRPRALFRDDRARRRPRQGN